MLEATCRKRSRLDQLSQGDSGCPDAARRSLSGLVPAADSCARDPEPLPELAGSGPLYYSPPRCYHRGAGH